MFQTMTAIYSFKRGIIYFQASCQHNEHMLKLSIVDEVEKLQLTLVSGLP